MSFSKFNLTETIQKALISEGYTIPTKIQEMAIPVVLKVKILLDVHRPEQEKQQLLLCRFLQLLDADKVPRKERRNIRALVLTPTRELAQQVSESFRKYGNNSGIRNTLLYMAEFLRNLRPKSLEKGVDILIATPGRLLDLMQQRFINLNNIKILVLDEADRMLDMGFLPDIRKLLQQYPRKTDIVLFSNNASGNNKLTKDILKDPVKISVTPDKPAVESIRQELYYVSRPDKKSLLTSF
jgi:ATP-dependent RNA helicase RhlE